MVNVGDATISTLEVGTLRTTPPGTYSPVCIVCYSGVSRPRCEHALNVTAIMDGRIPMHTEGTQPPTKTL